MHTISKTMHSYYSVSSTLREKLWVVSPSPDSNKYNNYDRDHQSKRQSNNGQYKGNANFRGTFLQIWSIHSLKCNKEVKGSVSLNPPKANSLLGWLTRLRKKRASPGIIYVNDIISIIQACNIAYA